MDLDLVFEFWKLGRQLGKTTLAFSVGLLKSFTPNTKSMSKSKSKSKRQLLKKGIHQLQNRLPVEIAELFGDWLKDEKMDSYVFGFGSHIWILLWVLTVIFVECIKKSRISSKLCMCLTMYLTIFKFSLQQYQVELERQLRKTTLGISVGLLNRNPKSWNPKSCFSQLSLQLNLILFWIWTSCLDISILH